MLIWTWIAGLAGKGLAAVSGVSRPSRAAVVSVAVWGAVAVLVLLGLWHWSTRAERAAVGRWQAGANAAVAAELREEIGRRARAEQAAQAARLRRDIETSLRADVATDLERALAAQREAETRAAVAETALAEQGKCPLPKRSRVCISPAVLKEIYR